MSLHEHFELRDQIDEEMCWCVRCTTILGRSFGVAPPRSFAREDVDSHREAVIDAIGGQRDRALAAARKAQP